MPDCKFKHGDVVRLDPNASVNSDFNLTEDGDAGRVQNEPLVVTGRLKLSSNSEGWSVTVQPLWGPELDGDHEGEFTCRLGRYTKSGPMYYQNRFKLDPFLTAAKNAQTLQSSPAPIGQDGAISTPLTPKKERT